MKIDSNKGCENEFYHVKWPVTSSEACSQHGSTHLMNSSDKAIKETDNQKTKSMAMKN